MDPQQIEGRDELTVQYRYILLVMRVSGTQNVNDSGRKYGWSFHCSVLRDFTIRDKILIFSCEKYLLR